MRLSTQDWKQILLDIADKVDEQKDYLSDLDRVIGDGDHGVSMAIGWSAIRSKLGELAEENDIGSLFQTVAKTFLNAVGASVGPLYGTAFLRGGAVGKGKSELSEEELIRFWSQAVAGIQQIGKAELGDKTMLDTWIPIVHSLEQSLTNGEPWSVSLDQAVQAGKAGMYSTKNMLSKKGRSGRLGDRSVGHIDPGAASAYLIFSAFADSWKRLQVRKA